MSATTVEDHVWGRIVTDAPQYRPVRVSMSYEPEGDPRAVRFAFPGGTGWTFPREVLESGLRKPVRSGDVEVWPCGRAQAVVEFHSAEGVAVVQFDSNVLNRFLQHTYAAAVGGSGASTEPGAGTAQAGTAGAAGTETEPA
ncbi:SsgA family sporulation/cell division regulator [Streptomyces sp. SID5473]|uniref:SsgA family sporulation/cell division regulator n=1 Tax=Streptomyces tsukubensis (strain DSM 42081 / NBRC 108919 / NRRL 18488 / 9993) TaxID=1114943 RepID=I2MZT7_STRT9|nr:adenylate cyclase [Streptomyces tsukubensis]EIF90284.1 sporulation/cell division protein [Streptomyces tsukubensis NRRL18488]MYS67611.1 SsgA family sporulation/cell division regulator [Streptomyces sp. SID5473]QKM69389.1 SsgA family sporulation/cell division regulator [Streptomyces tsukubensis NRRL18488]TAI42679.1 SsgA family sporulation/cell division regulator [Streptomyces tsukubensis]